MTILLVVRAFARTGELFFAATGVGRNAGKMSGAMGLDKLDPIRYYIKPNLLALLVARNQDWRAFLWIIRMVERVVVFVDYQNAYRRARTAFHNELTDPHWMGQFYPDALGEMIAGQRETHERQLHQVRMYRGLPDARKDRLGNQAALRQISAWQQRHSVAVTTRPLRYPRDYPASPPQEKGIDVQLALDFVMMAVRDEYEVGVLMSNDTDLRPALEEVVRLGRQTVEVATWAPIGQRRRYRLHLTGQFAGNQPYCHWIDHAAYLTVQDAADYTKR